MNGANGFLEVFDNAGSLEPMTNTVQKISISEVSVDSSYIRTTQTVTIKMDMGAPNIFIPGRDLYL
jgi:hypothetical protein